VKTGMSLKGKLPKNRAQESQGQREHRLEAQRASSKKSTEESYKQPKNYLLYFISYSKSDLNARCKISPDVERTIVS